MIPLDPVFLASIGLLCGLIGAAAFTMGDLHGEARALRAILKARTFDEAPRIRGG